MTIEDNQIYQTPSGKIKILTIRCPTAYCSRVWFQYLDNGETDTMDTKTLESLILEGEFDLLDE